VLEVSYRDRNNNRSPQTINLPITGALSFAEALVYADALVIELSLLTTAVIDRVSLRYDYKDPVAEAIDAVAGSSIETKGVFMFQQADGSVGKIEIPSVSPGIVVKNTNTINDLNPGVIAFVATVLNGPPGANNGITNGKGVQFTKFLSAHQMTRKNNKG
jgi:hypothetical protein